MAQQKKIYILAGQTDQPAVEQLKANLTEVGRYHALEFNFVHRDSLRTAQAHLDEDTQAPADLVFVGLGLTRSDRSALKRIRDIYNPDLSVDSFSSLRFVQQLKARQPNCKILFFGEIEHCSLTNFLLSQEVNADWFTQTKMISTSLAALWVKLFLE